MITCSLCRGVTDLLVVIETLNALPEADQAAIKAKRRAQPKYNKVALGELVKATGDASMSKSWHAYITALAVQLGVHIDAGTGEVRVAVLKRAPCAPLLT